MNGGLNALIQKREVGVGKPCYDLHFVEIDLVSPKALFPSTWRELN